MQPTIEVVEVSPRDGFQSICEPIETQKKISIIEDLVSAGCKRVEIGSFVNPKAVPQMADTSLIAQHFGGRKDFRALALVPNLKGFERALENDVKEMAYVFSASDTHNQKNVGCSTKDSIEALKVLIKTYHSEKDISLRVSIGTAFDCPYQGRILLDRLRSVVSEVLETSDDVEIALCDTTGRATPFQVENAFLEFIKENEARSTRWAFHGHDTYGLGIANAFFAYRSGVRIFDSSAGGLGGCPFAPGASGNIATEDLVYSFEKSGIKTGVEFKSLLDVADVISELPGGKTASHLRLLPRDRLF